MYSQWPRVESELHLGCYGGPTVFSVKASFIKRTTNHRPADVDVVTLYALHDICHPSLLIHRPAEWVDETMHVNSLGRLRPPLTPTTAPGHGEGRRRSFVSTAQRLGGKKGARLDRESLGRWPYTPDSDNPGVGVHSQWAGGRGSHSLSLSLSPPCTSCISPEERVMSPIRFPHGSA